jgi:outer membrane protein assembly factor BamD (BamD/ComL family)
MGADKVKKTIALCALVTIFSITGIAISVAQTSDDLLIRGYEAYNRRDWPLAIQSYRSAVSNLRYSTPENWFMLILSQLYAGEYGGVITDGDIFLSSFPASSYTPYVRYHMGRANYLAGNYANAAYFLTEFCHAYPNHELFPSAIYWIAESFFARENYDAARSLYERIIRDFPGDAKRADAVSRIETIKWFRRTESQLQAGLASPPPGMAPAPVREEPRRDQPGTIIATEAARPGTDQQQFVATLMDMNAQVDKDKQALTQRLDIVVQLILRNTTANMDQRWNSEQQRYIADLLARSGGTFALAASSAFPPSQQDNQIAELLTRNADLNYRQVPLAQRQALVAELHTLNNKLNEERQYLEGQQRLIAEVITNSMGLNGSSGGVAGDIPPGNPSVIDSRLSNLAQQAGDPTRRTAEATEYQSLLNKAQTLWAIIEERNKY